MGLLHLILKDDLIPTAIFSRASGAFVEEFLHRKPHCESVTVGTFKVASCILRII